MEERDNKTIVCSVLFLDIVEYSQKNVSGQISLKEGFNVFLTTAVNGIPPEDRIILDTGDGAAISFIGDIEDALKVGLSMRNSLMKAGVFMDTPLLVRMGINLGPVRLVKDINNQPNIVGDGINVAQRVMDFADVGQLLVSRSYYDAVSRISQEYAGMFHYQGSRTDKHVREHEVYAIGYPGEFTISKKRAGIKDKAVKIGLDAVKSINTAAVSVYADFQKASTQQKIVYAGLPLFALVLLIGTLSLWKRGQSAQTKPLVVRYYPEADHTVSAASQTSTKGVSGSSVNKADTKIVPPGKKIEKPSIARVRTLEQTTGTAAVVHLTVLPWGEVYLDGRKQGVSPPLLELQVAPGKHEIEIRNSGFPAFKQSLNVKIGEKLTVKHTFAN